MADGERPPVPSPALPDGDGGGSSEPLPSAKEPLPQRAVIVRSAIAQQRGAGEGAGAPARRPGDSAVELIISWLLRIGVWSSVAIIVVGFALLIAQDHDALLHAHKGGLEGLLKDGFPGEPAPASTYGGVISSVRHGRAFGVLSLGLLVLLFTPVLRVAISIVAFLVERDWLYTVITTVVLLLLLTGIVLGKAGG